MVYGITNDEAANFLQDSIIDAFVGKAAIVNLVAAGVVVDVAGDAIANIVNVRRNIGGVISRYVPRPGSVNFPCVHVLLQGHVGELRHHHGFEACYLVAVKEHAAHAVVGAQRTVEDIGRTTTC